MILDEELYVLGADGTRHSFSWSCAPLYDDQGHIVGAVSVARDVSAERRSRGQLAPAWPLLDHTENAIIAFDAEWRATAWNKGAERMYGWSGDETLGGELRGFVGADLGGERRAEIRGGRPPSLAG